MLEPLQQHRLPVGLSRLEFGDVAFKGRGANHQAELIGVELKTIRDLVASLRSGRLQGHQLPGLLRTYNRSWLVVEGEWRTNAAGALLVRYGRTWVTIAGQMTAVEMEKQLLTLQLKGGLYVHTTNSRQSTLCFLVSLYHWFTDKDFETHRSHLQLHVRPHLTPYSQCRTTLETLPGVGAACSGRAEAYFGGSLRRAINATADDWQHIDGIGTKTAAAIVASVQ